MAAQSKSELELLAETTLNLLDQKYSSVNVSSNAEANAGIITAISNQIKGMAIVERSNNRIASSQKWLGIAGVALAIAQVIIALFPHLVKYR